MSDLGIKEMQSLIERILIGKDGKYKDSEKIAKEWKKIRKKKKIWEKLIFWEPKD